MDIVQTFWLALLQGLTEFLPISSSAHLILLPYILDWPLQGLAFDVAVHLGTLLAVLYYYRKDLKPLTVAGWQATQSIDTQEGRLVINIIIATIPVIMIGLIFHDVINTELRTPHIIAITTIIFGALLGMAHFCKGEKILTQIDWRTALLIGIAQALALIPGVSRSGITITVAVFLGITREAALKFSFLLSIPVIAAASTLEIYKLMNTPQNIHWASLISGVIIAFISAYFAIRLFFAWLDKIGFMPFFIYRMILGGALLWLI